MKKSVWEQRERIFTMKILLTIHLFCRWCSLSSYSPIFHFFLLIFSSFFYVSILFIFRASFISLLPHSAYVYILQAYVLSFERLGNMCVQLPQSQINFCSSGNCRHYRKPHARVVVDYAGKVTLLYPQTHSNSLFLSLSLSSWLQ